MPQLTKEQEADVKERVEAFKKEYSELVVKHQVDFYAFPQLLPNEKGTFEVAASMTIFDKKYLPVPTPFKKDESIIQK